MLARSWLRRAGPRAGLVALYLAVAVALTAAPAFAAGSPPAAIPKPAATAAPAAPTTVPPAATPTHPVAAGFTPTTTPTSPGVLPVAPARSTPTPTTAPTFTATATATRTTATATAVWTTTPTASPTPRPTYTPTATATVWRTPTALAATPTATATASPTATPDAVATIGPTLPPPPPPAAAQPLQPYSGIQPITRTGDSESFILNVPYRSQFDNSPYQNANCGPAALGMVLQAYGLSVPNDRLRAIADSLQGTYGYDDGIALDYLVAIAQQAGLRAEGLTTANGHYRRWSMGDVINEIRQGYPVITLVHYASLPDHATSGSISDHFIVVVGVTMQGFVINDPAYVGSDGYHKLVRPEQILQAWAAAGLQNQAAAFLPPNGPTGLSLNSLPNPAPLAPVVNAAASQPLPAAPLVAQARPIGPPPPPPTFIQAVALPPSPTPTPTMAPTPNPTNVAMAASLSGWQRPGASPTFQAHPPTPDGSTGGTLVLAERSTNDGSIWPAVIVALLVSTLAVAIVKAPTRDDDWTR